MATTNTFSPGDTVAIYGGDWTVDVVKNVTPTGRIVTEKGGKFAPNGHEMGQSLNPRRLMPMTPEVEDRILRQDLLRDIPNTKWRKLTTETLKKVKELIEEGLE